MKDKKKKIQAAIIAALQYIQEEEKAKNKNKNIWASNGRERIMQNNQYVQKRGRVMRPGRV